MISKFSGTDVASWVGIGVSSPTINSSPNGKAHVSTVQNNKTISNNETDGAIRTMQKLMMDLGSQLSQSVQAQAIVKNNPNTKLSPEQIQAMARQFSNTAAGGLGKSPIDGVWGKNTHDALILINQLVQALGIKDVIISEGTGPSPYKTNDDLFSLAKQNIDNLSRLFSHAGATTTVQEVANNNVSAMIVDMVDPNLPAEGVNNPFAHWGNHPVLVSDLTNFTSFFEFISSGFKPPFPCESLESNNEDKKTPLAEIPGSVTASNEDYLQKIAKEVLDGSIYRLGQEQVQPVAVPTSVTNDPHCVSVIEQMIQWFKDRASEMFDYIYKSYNGKSLPSPRPDRKGKVGTLLDAQLADYYVRQMGKISDEWKDIKNSIINILKDRGSLDKPIVTSTILRDAISGSKKGKAHETSNKNESNESTKDRYESNEGQGRTIHQRTNAEPLSDFISVQDFENFEVPSLDKLRALSDGKELPELELRKLRSGSWQTLANQWVAGVSTADKYRNFGAWISTLRDVIREAYRDWKGGRHNRDSLQNQYTYFSQWIAHIDGVIGTYRNEMESAISRERGR